MCASNGCMKLGFVFGLKEDQSDQFLEFAPQGREFAEGSGPCPFLRLRDGRNEEKKRSPEAQLVKDLSKLEVCKCAPPPSCLCFCQGLS